MASETKVGLLAGLAFIVVFAVILANRGQIDPLLSQEPLSTQRQVSLGEQSVPTSPYRVHDTARALPAKPRPSKLPTTAQRVPSANRPAGERGAPNRRATAHRPPGTRRITFGADDVGQPLEIVSRNSSPQASLQSAAESAHVVATTLPVQSPLTLQQQIPTHTATRNVGGSKYVVLAGDTLYSIAGDHYGKRTGKFVRAIVKANVDTLPNPDKLRVGAVLMLPSLSPNTKLAATSPVVPAKSLRRTPASTAPAKKQNDFDWYQVKKGDRYASIAREKLGDVKRWREVFELNKDKFPNPDRIRDGVLIKIPRSRGGKKG